MNITIVDGGRTTTLSKEASELLDGLVKALEVAERINGDLEKSIIILRALVLHDKAQDHRAKLPHCSELVNAIDLLKVFEGKYYA